MGESAIILIMTLVITLATIVWAIRVTNSKR